MSEPADSPTTSIRSAQRGNETLITNDSEPANHLNALTGMRFFAAFAVVVHHLISDHNGDGMGRFGLPTKSLVLGGAAVSFFFVLSGFILTYVYKDQLTYGGVKKFYFKRWARIWPLHLACLIIAIFAINISIKQWDMFAVNLTLLQSWVPDTNWVFSFNGVSWSISTEMFFYVMFPFFLIGGQRRFWFKYAFLWIAVIGTVIGMQWLADHPQTSFYDFSGFDFDRAAHVNPFLRLPEFCTGMAVGYFFCNRAPQRQSRSLQFDTIAEVLALALIPAFSLTYRALAVTWVIRHAEWGGSAMALWVQYAGMVFVFAIIIYVFSRSNGYFAKLLGSRGLVFLGEISFALYMIHFLVIVAVDRVDWSGSSLTPWLPAICVIAISLGLAAFLYKLVEMPAKSALMHWYAGRYAKSLATFPNHLFGFLKTPTCWCYLILIGGAFGGLAASYQPLNIDARVKQVIANSHAPYKDVSFGTAIRLMGAKATPTPAGVELEMVWQKREPMSRLRFLHLCDDDGNVVSQLAAEQELFATAELLEPVIDKVLITNEKLSDERITKVGVGFYSQDIDPETNKLYPMLQASKGPVDMSKFRLIVIVKNQLDNLRKQMTNFVAEPTGDQ